MILQFSFMEILVSFSLLILIFMKLVNRIQSKHSALNLPPGPRKIPFIGNMHLLVGPLPHHALRGLAMKYGPLMHLQLGEVSTVIISSPDVAEEVMKTQDTTFASRPEILAAKVMSCDCPGIIFSPYGDYWRQLRKICTTELLSSKCVQSFRSLREEEFLDLCRWIASKAGSPINLTEKVYLSAYSLTAKAAFGKKTKDQETFISTQQADRILETIINEHIVGNSGKTDVKEKHDLVDVLLKCQEDENIPPLTSAQIKSVLLDIFGAGSETSATTVDWAMSEMLRNPSALKKAQDEVRNVFRGKNVVDEARLNELKFLKSVIKETLRLHPPAPLLLPRESNESCKIDGYDIPIKTRVIVNAWAIGRDAKYWEQPECFQPERFLDSSVDYKGNNFQYIPFGAGRRICPGISFGIANVELPLAMFLYHFDWSLPQGMKHEEMDMTEAFGVTVRRKDDLFVTPVLRRPFPV
ncbi:UNVERIFIED_CONTAM: cytochrome [Sesamum calycinum]|uniref:Cytochrome n=1 Tax=Sesamum calycinum TaxID=2727403 RepID=A0AAW2Q5U4_9LAMI